MLVFFNTDHYFTCQHKSKHVGIRADYGSAAISCLPQVSFKLPQTPNDGSSLKCLENPWDIDKRKPVSKQKKLYVISSEWHGEKNSMGPDIPCLVIVTLATALQTVYVLFQWNFSETYALKQSIMENSITSLPVFHTQFSMLFEKGKKFFFFV